MRSILVLLALILLLACTPAAMAQKGAHQTPQSPAASAQSFVGVWQNVNALTKIWIEQTPDGPHVASIIDFDDEVFTLLSEWFQDNRMQLTYYVPSTQYTVSFDCGVVGDMLQCSYENDHGGSGPSPWRRVR